MSNYKTKSIETKSGTHIYEDSISFCVAKTFYPMSTRGNINIDVDQIDEVIERLQEAKAVHNRVFNQNNND